MKKRTGYIEIWTKAKFTDLGIPCIVGIYHHTYPVTFKEVKEFWIPKAADRKKVYCKMFKKI